MRERTKFVIINRSFWPDSQALGEALLQFAERLSQKQKVCIVTQSKWNLREKLSLSGRAEGIDVKAAGAFTDSASSIFLRGLEAFYFMVWVLYALLVTKPNRIYVSTNPPIIVPFIVALYCSITNAKYYYHLQDIHPEATNIIKPLNKYLFGFFRVMDNYSIRKASKLVTLSSQMKEFIEKRVESSPEILLLDNPSVPLSQLTSTEGRSKKIVFCGNAGRLQQIPLLLAAIETYIAEGGELQFTFIGAGIYAPKLASLSKKYKQVDYLGFLQASEAAKIIGSCEWGLLPINDEVTKYAFPSKSSTYVLAGCKVLAVCSKDTSVSSWVKENKLGVVCEPKHNALVSCFKKIDNSPDFIMQPQNKILERLDIAYFVSKLDSYIGI